MAKYAVILSVIFSVFLLSQARIPSNLDDVPVAETITLSISSENDDKTTLLPIEEIKDTIAAVGVTRPLTMPFNGRFRPFSLRFPNPSVRRPFPHNCRHHHRHHHHGGEHGIQIPFGNDMIRDDVRQIPYGDDMIGADGRRIPQNGFGFGGERHGDVKAEEEGGFMRWFREMLNRF